MTVYRVLSTFLILGLTLGMAFRLRVRLGTWSAVLRRLRGELAGALGTGTTLPALRRLVYRVTLALALVLALTAFVPVIMLGDHPTGTFLVIHVTVAPFFALSLCAAAVVWAHAMRLRAADWDVLVDLLHRRIPGPGRLSGTLRRGGFWLVLLASLPLMLSIILGMFPLFGTEGEEYLIGLHGYSALVLTLVALLVGYLSMNLAEHQQSPASKEERS